MMTILSIHEERKKIMFLGLIVLISSSNHDDIERGQKERNNLL